MTEWVWYDIDKASLAMVIKGGLLQFSQNCPGHVEEK